MSIKSRSHFLGIFGAVVLLFGLSGALFIFHSFTQPFFLAHIVVGAACLLLWAFRFGKSGFEETNIQLHGRASSHHGKLFLRLSAVLALVIFANVLAVKKNIRWDLTESGVYSLAPQSKQIIEHLTEPLHMVVVRIPGRVDRIKSEDLMLRYQSAYPELVSYEFVDPRRSPGRVEHELKMQPGNIIFLRYGKGPRYNVARLNTITEESITNALLKITRGTGKRVLYVSGHEEPEFDSAAPEGLKKLFDALKIEQIELEPRLLGALEEIPEEYDAVFLVAPKQPLLDSELNLLRDYLKNGGSAVVLLDPLASSSPSPLMEEFGIQIGNDIILDKIEQLQGAPEVGWQVLAKDFTKHPITLPLTRHKESATVFLIASSVTPVSENPGEEATILLKSGLTSWAERDTEALFSEHPEAILDPSRDTVGPISLGVAKKFNTQKGEGRLVVYGDAEWIRNVNLEVYSNRELILNSLNWAVGETAAIALRPQTLRSSKMPLQSATLELLLALSFLLPELVLLGGLWIWWKRRSS